MTDARGPRPSRRAVLSGAGLLLAAACTGSSPSAGPPPLTSDQRLARRVAAEITELTLAYEATIARHPATGKALGSLLAEHRAHVTALVALLPAPTSTPSGSPTTPLSGSPTPSPAAPVVPPSAGAARSALAAAERAASKGRSAQAVSAGPELARLLASIAACEAVHAGLVAP